MYNPDLYDDYFDPEGRRATMKMITSNLPCYTGRTGKIFHAGASRTICYNDPCSQSLQFKDKDFTLQPKAKAQQQLQDNQQQHEAAATPAVNYSARL